MPNEGNQSQKTTWFLEEFCHTTPVDLVEFDRGEVVGIMPGTPSYDHLPPHTAVLRGMDPGGILKLTRLIEVQDKIVREHVAGIV